MTRGPQVSPEQRREEQWAARPEKLWKESQRKLRDASELAQKDAPAEFRLAEISAQPGKSREPAARVAAVQPGNSVPRGAAKFLARAKNWSAPLGEPWVETAIHRGKELAAGQEAA